MINTNGRKRPTTWNLKLPKWARSDGLIAHRAYELTFVCVCEKYLVCVTVQAVLESFSTRMTLYGMVTLSSCLPSLLRREQKSFLALPLRGLRSAITLVCTDGTHDVNVHLDRHGIKADMTPVLSHPFLNPKQFSGTTLRFLGRYSGGFHLHGREFVLRVAHFLWFVNCYFSPNHPYSWSSPLVWFFYS